MSFQANIADALLDTIKGCVLNCEAYQRILWQLGDPTIECSTLGIGIQSFPIAAEVADCSLNELRMNVIVAQCCYPVGQNDGTAPSSIEIIKASRCVLDDVERIMCCLRNVKIEIDGLSKPCRPKILAPSYSRPSGGCVVAKIGLSLIGVPCCE